MITKVNWNISSCLTDNIIFDTFLSVATEIDTNQFRFEHNIYEIDFNEATIYTNVFVSTKQHLRIILNSKQIILPTWPKVVHQKKKINLWTWDKN